MHARMVECKIEKIVSMNWEDTVIFRCVSVGANAFTCQCMSGYTGLNCETLTTSKIKVFILFFFWKVKFFFLYELANNCLYNPSLCLNGGV
jgi:hypothetical protein